MEYREVSGGIIVSDIGEICLENIFDNGQCFRFVPEGDAFRGVAFGKYINFEKTDEGLYIYPCTKEDFLGVWYDFLDLGRDYDNLFKSPDEYLKKGIEYAPGLRILRQDPYETLISFIISANNNIKRIRSIIEKMCKSYGEEKICGDTVYYDFPSAGRLAALKEEDLTAIGAGYRAAYIIKTAKECITTLRIVHRGMPVMLKTAIACQDLLSMAQKCFIRFLRSFSIARFYLKNLR